MESGRNKGKDISAARAALDGEAAPPLAAHHTGPQEETRDDAAGSAGDSSSKPRRPVKSFPDDCPLTPLGMKGQTYFYLDEQRQLVALKARDHSRNQLISLFGTRSGFAHIYWTRYDKEAQPTWKLSADACADSLMAACAARGVWSPEYKVRGPGAWPGDDGALILHAGGEVLVGDRWQLPGLIGKHVYTAGEAGPRPDMAADQSLVSAPLALLESWVWKRGALDAYLAYCWIACAMVGGALRWRPMAWLTGDRGTGKSTLHELLKAVLGGALLHATDATAAGLWQRIGYSSRPVALDEIESEEDNRRQQAVIKLARLASSGGVVVRGGSDHSGAEFTARSCFLFSSILVPPLQPQDRSRIAVLELDPLPKGMPPVLLNPALWARWGEAMLGTIIKRWRRWPQTLHAFQFQMQAQGHSARAADQYGTLLAMGDLLLGGEGLPDGDSVTEWLWQVSPEALVGRQEDVADHDACLAHLLSSQIDLEKASNRKTVAAWLSEAAYANDKNTGFADEPRRKLVRSLLHNVGLAVKSKGGSLYLAVSIQAGEGLSRIFAGTKWGAAAGAAGVWVQSLRRHPQAVPCDVVKLNRVSTRCVLLPLAAVLDEEGDAE